MKPAPTIAEILKETQTAWVEATGSKTAWRSKYGCEPFAETLRANTILAMLRWSQSARPTESGEVVKAIEALTEAIYRR